MLQLDPTIEITETGKPGEFMVYIPTDHPLEKKISPISSPTGFHRRKGKIVGTQWLLTEDTLRMLGVIR
jgi:hypothetical protein